MRRLEFGIGFDTCLSTPAVPAPFADFFAKAKTIAELARFSQPISKIKKNPGPKAEALYRTAWSGQPRTGTSWKSGMFLLAS